MIASQLVVWFSFFGLVGWLFESTYCSVVEKRWCNRGFLFGPICPIYGAGAVGALAVFGNPLVSGALPPAWAIFLVCAAGASAIEWVTSVFMEKVFGTVWWDYTDMPLNLDGRICVPAATLFGLGGLAIVYVALPLVNAVNAAVDPLTFEVAALILMALLAADTTLAVCALTEVIAAVERVQGSFDNRVQGALESGAEKAGRVRESGAGAVGRVRETGAEAVGRVRETGAEAVDRLLDTRDDYAERLRDAASHMSGRHQHILHNMRRFHSKKLKGTAARLVAALDNLKKDNK